MLPDRTFGSEHTDRMTPGSEVPFAPTDGSVLDKESWHQIAERSVREARRSGTPLSVIFVDVNYFKDINDVLGHEAGDKVIAAIREILLGKMRLQSSERRVPENLDLVAVSPAAPPKLPDDLMPKDIKAGHVGGDEFGLLCKTDESSTRIIVQRLRDSFNDYLLWPENEALRKLDISLAIGASTLEPGWDSSKLLSEADWAMYRDKESQLKPLNEAQEKFLSDVAEGLHKYEIRVRDVGKYLVMLSKADSSTE